MAVVIAIATIKKNKRRRRRRLVEALIQWELRFNGGKPKPINVLAEMKLNYANNFGWPALKEAVREAVLAACRILMAKPAKPMLVKGQKQDKVPRHKRKLRGAIRFPACYVRL